MDLWGEIRKSLVRLAPALLLALLVQAAPAAAQTTTAYVSGSDGALDSAATCTNPLVRNFSVGTNYVVSDVDIGIYATHTRRGSLRMTLQSPAGTRVQIVSEDVIAIDGDNFNVRLNDGGSQVVNTDGDGTNHSTAHPPPFQNIFAPNSPLSAFNGQSSLGTWRLEICNNNFWFWSGTGTFRHAELYLTNTPASYADLSLSKSVSSATPSSGATISYALTVTNAAGSPSSATAVAVTDLLPAGVSYIGHSGFGAYDPATGTWAVGTLAPGQSRSLTINAAVTASAGAVITNRAEVSASSLFDIDSTPGNGAAGEDDSAEATITVSGARVAGTPPSLVCPKGVILFDWDTRAWSDGATSASYGVTGLGTVSFSITNPGVWLNLLGGQNPRRTAEVTGGLTPGQYSLAQTVNLASSSQVAATTISLPLAVDGLQFRLFDVDYGANQFADRVLVTGAFNGTPVTPVLTNGVANYVIGNQAFGDAAANNDSANGNVTVTFQSAVDTVVIEYGNHGLAPADPGQQAITLHDITLCEPHADLSVTKISSVVSDPVRGTTDPVAIPGARISYCILVANSGSAAASAVVASDTLPATMTLVPGTMRSGVACGSTTVAEDDDAAGADEADPIGVSIAGDQLTITTASLGSSGSIAVAFDVTIN